LLNDVSAGKFVAALAEIQKIKDDIAKAEADCKTGQVM